MDEFSFERLDVYKETRKLVVSVYEMIDLFPLDERFALASQLRRSIVSIPSNIAEGSGRIHCKEKIHFLEIAFGSLMEAFCQLQIAQDLGYISKNDIINIKPQFFVVSRKISALKAYFEKANH